MEITIPAPQNNILPSLYADQLGILYTSSVTKEHKKKLGQYFTPWKVAKYMADYSTIKSNKIKILDPGCGIGILACSVIERLLDLDNTISEIELKCFETDNHIITYSDECLKYLHQWLRNRNIILTYYLCKNDFILHNSSLFNSKFKINEQYDIIITNPPYFKLNKKDALIDYEKSITYKQTNVYSIFVLLSIKLLAEHGQLIFITPRSFASGSYFQLFRERFFENVILTDIHLFESRKKNFERDKVLQENLIIRCTKKPSETINQLELNFTNTHYTVKIATSKGIDDVDKKKLKELDFKDLVNIESKHKILHIPTSHEDQEAIKIFKSWTKSLEDYNIKISTGPVVNFRNTAFIKNLPSQNCVPLISLAHIEKLKFTWPITKKIKGKYTGEYIENNSDSESILINNSNYVFLRRFSTKEDLSRLVAAPYFAADLKYSLIGIENHLNYIYKIDTPLKRSETLGLTALLNSNLFDTYFRTFNGNINVSATELRVMPFPPLEDIKNIGSMVASIDTVPQTNLDQLINDYFKRKHNSIA